MNLADEQVLRHRLREEFAALEISPAPVLRVTARGRGIRARRRALAAGGAVLAVLAVAAAAHFNRPAPAPMVTLNAPNPAAPGGVFASGTADGKRWALAVRNIAAAPGTLWCLPAVLLNGRDGDVLFGAGQRAPSFGNPAFLRDIAGLPGIGFMFTQVAPGVTRLAAAFSDGTQLTVRPVRVSACGQSFDLAGFAFAKARHSVMELDTYTRLGLDSGLPLTNSAGVGNVFRTTPPGIWANTDGSRADIAASRAAQTIGRGRIGFAHWTISESLGLFGQCYVAYAHEPFNYGNTSDCVPVSVPPASTALEVVPLPWNVAGGLTGYAGLVNPRTAYAYASLSNGTTHRVIPVLVAGRAYIALVIPPGYQLTWLSLFDASGQMFANVGHFIRPVPERPGPAGSS